MRKFIEFGLDIEITDIAALPQIITATAPPALGALTEGDAPEDAFTPGTYASTAGTIASAVVTYTVAGSPVSASDPLTGGQTVVASVLVTDSEGNTRSFFAGTVTVPQTIIAPSVIGSLSDISVALNSSPQSINAGAVFAGTDLQFDVSASWATIGRITGDLTLPTDTPRAGVVVTVTASNSQGSVQAAFQYTVDPAVNRPPVAMSDDVVGVEDTPVQMFVLANDTDPDGDTLTITGASVSAAQGAVTFDANSVTFTPASGFLGEAEVTYIASDPEGLTDTATATVTVEAAVVVPQGAIPFGGQTPAGAGGMPINGTSITSGDPNGHWGISGGLLAPVVAAGILAGTYNLTTDQGDTREIVIEPNKASTRLDHTEFRSVLASLPRATSRGLLVHDGDGRAERRLFVPGDAWTNTFTIEPTTWTEDPDERLSVRNAMLAAITLGAGSENVVLQGFECQMEAGPLLPDEMQNVNGDAIERVRTNSLIEIQLPSSNVRVRQNKLWSRTTADIVANDDYIGHWNTSRQLQGIKSQTTFSGARGQGIDVENNYIHDIEKGITITACDDLNGVRSNWSRNTIMDTYTGFGAIGYCDGVNIFDNRGLGVHAADEVTDGEVGSSNDGPHSGLFGFNADDPRTTINVSFMGNIFGSSAKVRNDLEIAARANGTIPNTRPLPTYGATGVKLNDPRAPDSYVNIKIGFNTLITRGLALELSGVTADFGQHVEVFHNTIAGNPDPQGGSAPVIYFTGSSRVRMWKNVIAGFALGAQDGTGFYPETLATLEGYGNQKINFGSNSLGEEDYFEGTDGNGTLAGALLDDYPTAYIPKADTGASLSPIRAGALGTGLYAGNGVHSAVYDKPAPSGGVTDVAPLTNWDGAAHFERGSQMTGSADAPWRSILFAWEGEVDAAQDGATMDLLSFPSNRLYFRKFGGGALQLYMAHSTPTVMIRALPGFTLTPADGLTRIAIAYDMLSGRIQFVKNGVLDNWMNVRDLAREASLQLGSSPVRLHASLTEANKFIGQFGRAYFDARDTFFDLEDPDNLSALFAADGSFRDWGGDGSLVTGVSPLIYARGTAAGIANLGRGGAFVLDGGALTDVSGGANTPPDAVDGTDTTTADTLVTVDLLANDTDLDGDTLTVTSATVPALQGTLVDNGDGTVDFTPANGFTGDAVISYDIEDGNGGTDSAIHTVTVGAQSSGNSGALFGAGASLTLPLGDDVGEQILVLDVTLSATGSARLAQSLGNDSFFQWDAGDGLFDFLLKKGNGTRYITSFDTAGSQQAIGARVKLVLRATVSDGQSFHIDGVEIFATDVGAGTSVETLPILLSEGYVLHRLWTANATGAATLDPLSDFTQETVSGIQAGAIFTEADDISVIQSGTLRGTYAASTIAGTITEAP